MASPFANVSRRKIFWMVLAPLVVVGLWVVSEFIGMEFGRKWDGGYAVPDATMPGISMEMWNYGGWVVAIGDGAITARGHGGEEGRKRLVPSTAPLTVHWHCQMIKPREAYDWVTPGPAFWGIYFPSCTFATGGPMPEIYKEDYDMVIVRLWFIAAIAALPLAWTGWRGWRHGYKAKLAGLCSTCRYDLRMHKAGERCPECGTVIEAVEPVG